MRRLTYYVAATLDGFIAGPDGQFDFFPFEGDLRDMILSEYPETMPVHARGPLGLEGAANRRFDTVVMGRATYQPALDAGLDSPYAHLDQHVVSTSLPGGNGAVSVTTEPVDLIDGLKRRDGLGIWLAGGGRLAASVRHQIDDMVIKRSPIVIGSGVPLFDGPFSPTAFVPVSTRRFDGGVTLESYARAA